MPALTLTHPEATPAQLTAALASTKERRLSLRLLALRKLQEGKPVSAIVEFFGVHRTMIPEWVKRVNAEGLAGLAEKPGRGRRHRLTDEQRTAIRTVLGNPPTDVGLTGNLWTGKLLKQYVEQTYHVTYGAGLTAMYRLLKLLGFTLQRPTKRYLGANPDKQAEFQAVVKKIWASVKDDPDVVVFAEDEAALISIPTLTRMWSVKGQQPKILTDTAHRQRVTLLGAVNLKTGELTGSVADRGNRTTFRSFLDQLLTAHPDKKLLLILDNVRCHHAQDIQAFLETEPRLEFIFLPAYSP